jgi:hypothetical protein
MNQDISGTDNRGTVFGQRDAAQRLEHRPAVGRVGKPLEAQVVLT